MKIYGFRESNGAEPIKFAKENGNDVFTLDLKSADIIDGKRIEHEPTKGQLHIPDGLFSKATGFFREYLNPYSWKPIYVEEGGALKRVLVYYPFPEAKKGVWSGQFSDLAGESPFWAKHYGEERFSKEHGQEFLVQKNALWTERLIGFSTANSQSIYRSKDKFISIYRTDTLIKKITLFFWRMFFSPFLIEVKIPSNGEKFWIKRMDYNLACKILGETLELDKASFWKPDNSMAKDSTEVAWVIP